MQFTTIVIAALSTLAAASPISLEARNVTTSTKDIFANTLRVIDPVLSLWYSGQSRIEYNREYGLAQRNRASWGDITTLATFDVPESVRGNTCELIFTLYKDSSATRNPVGTAEIFRNNQAVKPGSTSNYRGNQIGTMKITKGNAATFGTVDGRFPYALKYKCADLIGNAIFEVLPQGEDGSIFWEKYDGLRINVTA